MPQNQALYTGLQKKWVYFDFKPTLGIEGDVGVNANYLSHASNSVISFSLAARFTKDVFMPQNRATDAPCIPTSAPPPDIIFSSPSPPGPAGHPVSPVSACPLIPPLPISCQVLFPFAPTSLTAFSRGPFPFLLLVVGCGPLHFPHQQIRQPCDQRWEEGDHEENHDQGDEER